MNRSHAVIGAGFGDEGKGHVVDYLCSISPDPLVVRYCGGHQAAHHVVLPDGRDHVFAHFGSGALRGAPTYWGRDCIASPLSLLEEKRILEVKGGNVNISINPDCLVTTPYDVVVNMQDESRFSNGTCGVGIFETIKRDRDGYRLRFSDIFYPSVLNRKLELIRQHYGFPVDTINSARVAFLETCEEIMSGDWCKVQDHFGDTPCSTLIFEGSQGLLLDQDYGFYPHVTPASTGYAPLHDMGLNPTPWVVTRAYQTRHGNGPMGTSYCNNIKDNPYEMNGDDGAQGTFRRTLLDLEMFDYGLEKDGLGRTSEKNLVVTCMDLMPDDGCLELVERNGFSKSFYSEIDFIKAIARDRFRDVYISHSPNVDGIKKVAIS